MDTNNKKIAYFPMKTFYYVNKYFMRFGEEGLGPSETKAWLEGSGLNEKEISMAIEHILIIRIYREIDTD